MNLTKDQIKILYAGISSEQQRSRSISLVTPWMNNVTPQWMYKLACDVAKVDSMTDVDIIPTIFGVNWLEQVEKVAKSEYYFWQIAKEWVKLRNADENATAKRAISEIRCDNDRIFINKKAALSPETLTPQLASELTAYGVILWDATLKDFVVNPLFYDRDLKP
jgi:hypothetical protein